MYPTGFFYGENIFSEVFPFMYCEILAFGDGIGLGLMDFWGLYLSGESLIFVFNEKFAFVAGNFWSNGGDFFL